MNYWPRWISAIKKRTATLSLMQMGAYDRLLDHYYAEEKPLPGDLLECCRVAGAVTKAEQEAVRQVLGRFFLLTDAGYANERADEEIEIALPKIEAAKANGLKGGRPKGSADKPNRKPTGLANGNPSETHEEPTAKAPHPQSSSSNPSGQKNTARKRAPDELPDWLPSEWGDFLAHRKAMRGVPFTAAAQAGVIRELSRLRDLGHDPATLLTTAVVRGWRTVFEPKPSERAAVIPINRQEAQEQRNRAVGETWLREQEAADARQ